MVVADNIHHGQDDELLSIWVGGCDMSEPQYQVSNQVGSGLV